MSGSVGSVTSKSGMVENVGIAGEISFAVVIQAVISCIYADFKAFPVFRPLYWISDMRQLWFESVIFSQFIFRKGRIYLMTP